MHYFTIFYLFAFLQLLFINGSASLPNERKRLMTIFQNSDIYPVIFNISIFNSSVTSHSFSLNEMRIEKMHLFNVHKRPWFIRWTEVTNTFRIYKLGESNNFCQVWFVCIYFVIGLHEERKRIKNAFNCRFYFPLISR